MIIDLLITARIKGIKIGIVRLQQKKRRIKRIEKNRIRRDGKKMDGKAKRPSKVSN